MTPLPGDQDQARRPWYAPLCRSWNRHDPDPRLHHEQIAGRCACPCHGGSSPWWFEVRVAATADPAELATYRETDHG